MGRVVYLFDVKYPEVEMRCFHGVRSISGHYPGIVK